MGVQGTRLDDLARDLASGAISRRTALRRLAAGAIGVGIAAAPSALAEELERGRCPKRRRCGKKCCPKGAKCKNGKCKCKDGLTKCGKKCADINTSTQHCGGCNNECDPGRACIDGNCSECTTPDDCPAPSECQVAVCDGEGMCGTTMAADGTTCSVGVCASGECVGLCGDGIIGPGEACDDGNQSDGDGCSSDCEVEEGFQCTGSPSICQPICGDGLIVGNEQCDGSNLNGETCQSLGHIGGTLGCTNDCQFDTSGCTLQ